MNRTFQSRLAAKHGLIKRKILDNDIELAGHPTDCIRIHFKDNDEGDHNAWEVEEATIDSIIFPPLQDIPYRKISCDGSGKYQITSLAGAAEEGVSSEKFKLTFTHKSDIKTGDFIVRVFVDPDVSEPIILALKVTELLGTFGHLMLESQSCLCNLEMERFPTEVSQVIGEMAERRLHIKF